MSQAFPASQATSRLRKRYVGQRWEERGSLYGTILAFSRPRLVFLFGEDFPELSVIPGDTHGLLLASMLGMPIVRQPAGLKGGYLKEEPSKSDPPGQWEFDAFNLVPLRYGVELMVDKANGEGNTAFAEMERTLVVPRYDLGGLVREDEEATRRFGTAVLAAYRADLVAAHLRKHLYLAQYGTTPAPDAPTSTGSVGATHGRAP